MIPARDPKQCGGVGGEYNLMMVILMMMILRIMILRMMRLRIIMIRILMGRIMILRRMKMRIIIRKKKWNIIRGIIIILRI
jgi:hypothetical protein